jgi:hypothetical protein
LGPQPERTILLTASLIELEEKLHKTQPERMHKTGDAAENQVDNMADEQNNDKY